MHRLSFAFVVVLAGAILYGQTPAREVKVIAAAADALGGRDRVLAIKTLTVTGHGHLASQMGGGNISPSPAAPQKWIHINDFEQSIDLEHRRMRVQQRQVTGFVFARRANYGGIRSHAVLDDAIGYNVGADGKATRVSDAVARGRRMEMLANPVVAIRAAMDEGAKLTNVRTVGNAEVVDVTTTKGDRMTIAIERTSQLPAWVSWVGPDENLGDVTYQTSFTAYEPVKGIRLPMGYSTRIDFRNLTLNTLMVDKNDIDAVVTDMTAPADVRSATAPTPRPMPQVRPLAKGMWFISGGVANSVLFEFADHLTLFESPTSSVWAKAVIDLARSVVPSKPLTEAIVSHHHFDHSGGLRTAVAEGLTIITQRGNIDLFTEMAARKSTVNADLLGRNPKAIKTIPVDDHLVLKDSSMEVDLYYVISNSHMANALFAYVPKERLMVQADLFVLDWDFQWWQSSYMDNVRYRKLQVEKDVPIHGPVVPFAEIIPNIQKQFRAAQDFCTSGFKAGYYIPGCPAK